MADKARHAFGALENIDSAISAGVIDTFDILFVKDANGKPYVGWVDKDGNKVICETDLTTLETQVTELNTQMEQKVDATTVQNMIEEHYDAAIEVVEF